MRCTLTKSQSGCRDMSRFENAVPGGATTEALQQEFHSKMVLFYIERSQNTNCVVYEANVDPSTGKLDAKLPMKVYWIMYAKGPAVCEEGLNMVERNTAYGSSFVPCTSRGEGCYTVTLTALKSKTIDIWVDDGVLHAVTSHDGVEKQLLNVYCEMTTSWGMPKLKYMDVRYMNPTSKEVDTERITPK